MTRQGTGAVPADPSATAAAPCPEPRILLLSWDALSHHVYLGMTAEQARWDLDVLPASYQTYQYPYLYWPVYKLSLWEAPGPVLGATWAGMQAALLMPPLWFICLRLLPDQNGPVESALWRAAGCATGAMSLVLLAGLESTANDVLATVPLLWAIALGLQTGPSNRQAFLAAALWGVCCLQTRTPCSSSGCRCGGGWPGTHWPWRRGVLTAIGALVGFGVYAPWGVASVACHGQSVLPPLLSLSEGPEGLRFQPDSWLEGLLRPCFWRTLLQASTLRLRHPDWRFAGFFASHGFRTCQPPLPHAPTTVRAPPPSRCSSCSTCGPLSRGTALLHLGT
jgi:hypothetical protein